MIFEGSRGLFHRGILMAGSTLHNGYSFIPRRNWAQRLAAGMGLNSTSDREIYNFLENADSAGVVQAQMNLLSIDEMLVEGLSIPFGPTIEPFQTSEVFLDRDIKTLVRNAWGNNICLLIGAASFETMDLYTFLRDDDFLKIFSDFNKYILREREVIDAVEVNENILKS